MTEVGKDLEAFYGKDYTGTPVWLHRRDDCISQFSVAMENKGIQWGRKRGRDENPVE